MQMMPPVFGIASAVKQPTSPPMLRCGRNRRNRALHHRRPSPGGRSRVARGPWTGIGEAIASILPELWSSRTRYTTRDSAGDASSVLEFPSSPILRLSCLLGDASCAPLLIHDQNYDVLCFPASWVHRVRPRRVRPPLGYASSPSHRTHDG